MQEKVVKTKSCNQCGASFDITDKDLEFYDKISPIFSGKKYHIPAPTLCPDCRQQRRFSIRNEKNLYNRKCDLSGRQIVSLYSPDKSYKIYDKDSWWSNKWDPIDYGTDLNFEKPFFEQYNDLFKQVPHIGMTVVNGVNSEFNIFCKDIKNCYLSSRVGQSEEIYYSYLVLNGSHDCYDCYNITKCNHCYELIDSRNCHSCFYTKRSIDSSNLYYCDNCIGCNDCFGCFNLSNKQYYFFNKKLTKDEYFSKFGEYNLGKIIEINKNQIFRENSNVNFENCLGNNLVNCKNVIHGFDCNDIDTGKYVYGSIYGTNQIDTDYNYYGYNNYEEISCGNATNAIFSFAIFDSSNILYSINCYNSKNLLGCVGVKNKEYCILNKQYTKEEYETLVPKIIEHMKSIGEWGEFFTSNISLFGYNETVAQEYFPLTKTEALNLGFKWSEYVSPQPKAKKTISADKLPDDILNIPDDILNWVIECEITKKPFRILAQELEFYRKHNLPIPKKHPDQRYKDRIKLRNPRKLFDRKCDKCRILMKTTFSPDREEIVYCENCYNKEIY